MLAHVLSTAVNGIEASPAKMEVHSGWGDTIIVLIMSISPIPPTSFYPRKKSPVSTTLESEDRRLLDQRRTPPVKIELHPLVDPAKLP